MAVTLFINSFFTLALIILSERLLLPWLITLSTTESTLLFNSTIFSVEFNAFVFVLKLNATLYCLASSILFASVRFLLVRSPFSATSLLIAILIFDREMLEFLKRWINFDLLILSGCKYCSNSFKFLARFSFLTFCISELNSLRSSIRFVLFKFTCWMKAFFLFCGKTKFVFIYFFNALLFAVSCSSSLLFLASFLALPSLFILVLRGVSLVTLLTPSIFLEKFTFSDVALLDSLLLPAPMMRTFMALTSVSFLSLRMLDCMLVFKFILEAIFDRSWTFSANVPLTFSSPAFLIRFSRSATRLRVVSVETFILTPNCLARVVSRCFSVFNVPVFLWLLSFLASSTSLPMFLFPLLNLLMIVFLFWEFRLSALRFLTRRVLAFSPCPRDTSSSRAFAARLSMFILSPALKRVRKAFLLVWLIFKGVRYVRRFCFTREFFSLILCSTNFSARFFNEFKFVLLSIKSSRLFLSSFESLTLTTIPMNFIFWFETKVARLVSFSFFTSSMRLFMLAPPALARVLNEIFDASFTNGRVASIMFIFCSLLASLDLSRASASSCLRSSVSIRRINCSRFVFDRDIVFIFEMKLRSRVLYAVASSTTLDSFTPPTLILFKNGCSRLSPSCFILLIAFMLEGTFGTLGTLGAFGTLGTLGAFGTLGTLGAFGTLGTLGNTGSPKPFGLGRGPCPPRNGTLDPLFL